MKPRFVLIASALVSLALQSAYARKLEVNQLPSPVQRTVQTETKNGPVQEVQSLEHNGRTIYEVALQPAGGARKVIYLEENGTYVQDPPNQAKQGNQAAGVNRDIDFNQAPEAVRRTVNTETRNGPVTKVQQLSQNGKTIYAVHFQPTGGANEKLIYLNPDGTYVQQQAGTHSWDQATAKTHSWDHLTAGSRLPLSAANKLTIDQVPAAVQRVFKAQAGTAPIESIDRGTLDGKTVYEAAFKRSNQTVKLRVAADGTPISDAQNNRILAGGPLTNSQTVTIDQLPATVQRTIHSQSGNEAPKSIRQGQVNGQTVYEASLQQNGQPVQVRVHSDGSLLSVQRQAQSSMQPAQP